MTNRLVFTLTTREPREHGATCCCSCYGSAKRALNAVSDHREASGLAVLSADEMDRCLSVLRNDQDSVCWDDLPEEIEVTCHAVAFED